MKSAKHYGWTVAMIIVCAIGGALVSAGARDNAAPQTPLASDGEHDPANPAQPSQQNPDESMANFPIDRRGEVQWVEALKQGVIKPRKYVAGDEGKEQDLIELDLDIIMQNTAQMPHVRFPHLAHTRWPPAWW